MRKYGPGASAKQFPQQFFESSGKRGLTRKDLMPNLNLFSRVMVSPEGELSYSEESEKPGSFIDLRAEMKCIHRSF
jgi:hypothetical protein